jgi:cation diffusion facilitator CzcD-associated flavoprotein CzcO
VITPITVNVAIIGAGPNGLSLAAHLSDLQEGVRIFGKPMDTWQNHMPKRMFLKSDGFASDLVSTAGDASLADFCARSEILYDDFSIPVSLNTFVKYGIDFQRRFVPNLDERCVVEVDTIDGGFRIELDDGEIIRTRRVVMAVGITHFDYTPGNLAALPGELASHSSAHSDLEKFKNLDVTVVGAGASAVGLAVLLDEVGARVSLVARSPVIRFGSRPGPRGRSTWEKLRHPQSGLGPGLRSRAACDFPQLFRYLPASLRMQIVHRHLGPASAWYQRERFAGRISAFPGHRMISSSIRNGRVCLHTLQEDGSAKIIEADHVIAATGYRVDIERLDFISRSLRDKICNIGGMPTLSRNFECSVAGMYFAGLAAAGSFGPLMRFVYGCSFTAKRISRHIKDNS